MLHKGSGFDRLDGKIDHCLLIMPQTTGATDALMISIQSGSILNELLDRTLDSLRPAAPPGTKQERAPDRTDFLRHRNVPVESMMANLSNLQVKVGSIAPSGQLREIKRVVQVANLAAKYSEPYVANDRLLVTLESALQLTVGGKLEATMSEDHMDTMKVRFTSAHS